MFFLVSMLHFVLCLWLGLSCSYASTDWLPNNEHILQQAKAHGALDSHVSLSDFKKTLSTTDDLEGKQIHPFVRFVAACMRSGDERFVRFANKMVDSYNQSDLLSKVFGWQWGAKPGNLLEQTIYDVQRRVSLAFKGTVRHDVSSVWLQEFVPQFLNYRLNVGGSFWSQAWSAQLNTWGIRSWFEDYIPVNAVKDVVIVGAGLAGLTMAHELAKIGVEAPIFEARDRSGGRVWTKRFPGGKVCEMGATFVDEGHTNLKKLCSDLDVPLTRYVVNNGKRMRTFDSQGRPYSLCDKMPEMRAFFTDARLEEIRKKFITEQFFSKAVKPYLSLEAYAAMKLMVMDDAGLNLDGIPAPALWDRIQRSIDFYSPDIWNEDLFPQYLMTNGTSSLVEALAQGRDIHHRAVLQSLNREGDHWTLSFGDGQTVKARKVVIAVPLAVLKTIQFDPCLSLPIDKFRLVGLPQNGGTPYASHTRDVLDDPQGQPGDYYYEVNAQKDYVAWQGGSTAQTKAITRPSGARPLDGSKFTHDWGKDPFALGSYSLNGENDGVRGVLQSHQSEGLYFVGEYMDAQCKGYMEGAVRSALEVSQKLLESVH